MQQLTELTHSDWSRLQKQGWTFVLLVAALFLLHPATLLAGNPGSTVTSQVSGEATSDQVSPPNVVTGPDFRLLMEMMRKDIVRCGVPRTAVLHWHVLPDGLISDFVLHKPSGDACFDEIVILNAARVIKAQLRITPGTRNEVAAAAWVPFAVAARD